MSNEYDKKGRSAQVSFAGGYGFYGGLDALGLAPPPAEPNHLLTSDGDVLLTSEGGVNQLHKSNWDGVTT